jgi:hypothetical protein
MRFLFLAIVSTFVIAASPGAFAQSAPSTQDQAGKTQDDAEQQHPNWYKEPRRYRPCPASVEFPNGRQACLGNP